MAGQMKEGIIMGMMDAVRSCFNNFANFNGRARRSEYWYFTLFNFLVSFVIGAVAGFIAPQAAAGLGGIYGLITFIPSIAVGIRRLHDTGRSGWLYLLVLIPIVGGIIVIVFLCQDSQPGRNAYGFNPKQGRHIEEDYDF